MNKPLSSNKVFALAYIACLLPAYYLQAANIITSAHQLPESTGGWWNMHSLVLIGTMLALCWVCIVRGTYIGKRWIALLPAVAIAFELIPRLSGIPYVSTSYHVLAIVIGVAFPAAISAHSSLPNGEHSAG